MNNENTSDLTVYMAWRCDLLHCDDGMFYIKSLLFDEYAHCRLTLDQWKDLVAYDAVLERNMMYVILRLKDLELKSNGLKDELYPPVLGANVV